jgi:hypothetical protein
MKLFLSAVVSLIVLVFDATVGYGVISVGEAVVGTRGVSDCKSLIEPSAGAAWHYKGANPNPFSQEHWDLILPLCYH